MSQSSTSSAPPAHYITTAIPYVNAPPHIGFALEMIQADVIARHWRAKGRDVRFQAGSDENSLKNLRAAAEAGLPVETLVARNAGAFEALKESLDLSVDDFIRTSISREHRVGVEKLWAACAAKDDIYRKSYRGLYCVGCEQFYKAEDLEEGRCPEHKIPPEPVAEENYFFRLSRYQEALHDLILSDRLKITPAKRRNEVLAWIAGGLEDFSISRSAARAHGWGIPVPGDASQVIYVWFDALGNYITALDYGEEGPDFRRYWQDAAQRLHVIGKGITRFHALYWPAMLLSAGLPLPQEILVHGYVTLEGEKIGKSAGNAVDPRPLAEVYGADALRYYLLRHIRSGEDGDFSAARLQQAYRSELAGQLGNLVHRTRSMAARYLDDGLTLPDHPTGEGSALDRAAEALPAKIDAALETFAFDQALTSLWEVVGLANKHIAEREPWALAKEAETTPDAQRKQQLREELGDCLQGVLAALEVVGLCLAPFLPSTSASLLAQLEGSPRAADGQSSGLLFPPLGITPAPEGARRC